MTHLEFGIITRVLGTDGQCLSTLERQIEGFSLPNTQQRQIEFVQVLAQNIPSNLRALVREELARLDAEGGAA